MSAAEPISTAESIRIVIVVGTRPEAIKVLPVIQALKEHPRFEPLVVSTGQQRELVDSVLGLDGIRPDIDLEVGRPGVTLNELFVGVMRRLEDACLNRFGAPDTFDADGHRVRGRYPAACLVHGDTSSAAAAALASFYMRMPVAHIEAGLRTRSILSPFPEELNRQIIARVAAFHLAPTWENAENLVRERVEEDQIFVTGNTGIDALLWVAELEVPYEDPVLESLDDDDRKVVVVTAHRRENWESGLERIATAVAALAEKHPDVRFVSPIHPNPLVGATLRPILERFDNVDLVSAMDYAPFVRLLKRAHFAISDSGGIQEEAPALGTPVLVTRETTERQEGVEAGTIELVGTDSRSIANAAERLITDPQAHAAMANARNPYGDGRAAERIVAAFEHLAYGSDPPAAFGPGFRRAAVLGAAGFAVSTLPPPELEHLAEHEHEHEHDAVPP
jgi:UDP-N-acetylglucosamine 2-epimerase (non-hydrolysing)